MQAEIPNHRKLRRLRAGVVSVAVEVPWVAGQVGDEKTNVCEPLLTHRNKQRRHRNRTVWGGSETKACFSGCALSLMFNLAPPVERALSRLDGVSAGHGTATA